jgi:hypothetical protein
MEETNKNLIKEIDHSKIKEGEIIHSGYVWDVDGTCLRPIPYIEKTIEEISADRKNDIKSLEKRLKTIDKEINEREEVESKFIPISLSSLMTEEFGEVGWIVDKLIPLEGTTALSGSPASFKTWLALDIAIKVAKGEQLFGKFNTKKTGVLIIDEENGKRLLNSRLKKMCQVADLPVYFICLSGFKLGRGLLAKVVEITQKYGVGLVIFDSLVRIHDADENNAVEMAGVFRYFKELNKRGLTVLVTHHNRKKGIFKEDPAQSIRGSSDISASVECHLALDRKRGESFVTVIQAKNRVAEELKPFNLNIISDDNNWKFEYAGELDEKKMKKEDEQSLFLEVLKNLKEADLVEIYQSLKGEVGINKIREIAKELKGKGQILSKKEAHNREVFLLAESIELAEL